MNYKVYQVKRDLSREYAFMGLQMMQELGIQFSIDNYDLVYEGDIEQAFKPEPLLSTEANEGIDHILLLERLFNKFNTDHPADFKGHSMSVSDVVELNGVKYFCDSYGWEAIN